MSKLYFGSDPRGLADKLADELDHQAKHGDFFVPALIVVPNRYLRKWLRLWLARRLDVAINLDFYELDDALWQLLRQADPALRVSAAEPIDENIYRLMVLAVLLEDQDAHLGPLLRYLQLQGPSLTRLSCRRAWYLADRLGLLLQDYEYHRQEMLIQRWREHQYALGGAGEFHKMMERAQRTLFLHLTRERDGKRALLNRLSGKNFKTLPQYAMELMSRGKTIQAPGRIVHFFGFTQTSSLHMQTIGWLGQSFDVRFYHLNVLASHFQDVPQPESLLRFAQSFRDAVEDSREHSGDLLRRWGRTGAEALGLTARMLGLSDFEVEILPTYETPRPQPQRSLGQRVPRRATMPRNKSVLGRLQDQLLGPARVKARLKQDSSLQIVGCPGTLREVETVHNSILHNLQLDPALRQTDIAVLVTDMPKYRATLQAVLDRPPRHLQFNMVDFSAAGISMFGQALLGMLDLALESFVRARVFEVILNPCFLARLGVDRRQAMVWLEWAESLGIYQGWDAEEKHEQGYARSPFYAWRLGLQRLRLGRYMEVTREDTDQQATRLGHIIPFADLGSTDREHLDAFCKAVEGLLPLLARLRSMTASGQRWASVLQRLLQEFLEVPPDRPEEAQVRETLLAAFEPLAMWDFMQGAGQKSGMPLALVREYVQGQLEVLEANRGEYLIGGVTVSALQPMRPVPFQIIYVLGLSEDLFPGSNTLTSFDLRGAARIPGDIRPAEERLYDFLTTILAAQQKLYLLYNHHDLQKDQPLLPAVPVQQLQRHLSAHVLQGDFKTVTMPCDGDDGCFIDPAQQPSYQDVLVQYRQAERYLAILAAERENRLTLDLTQQAEWTEQRKGLHTHFSITPPLALGPLEQEKGKHLVKEAACTTVTLSELKRFLQFPAHASLRRHLRVEEEEQLEREEEEPLITPALAASILVRQTLQQLVVSAAQGDIAQALTDWQDRFAQTYADSRLRSRVPEEAFGEVDQAALARDLQERIHGPGRMESFLKEHVGRSFCGPVLLGESLMPIGAHMRLPATRLRPGHELPAGAAQEVRLTGWSPLAWSSRSRFEILIITNSKEIKGEKIHQAMLEPTLFYLALLANPEAMIEGSTAPSWLGQREFLVHVAHQSGIQTWPCPAGCITPAEATQYLVELTRDFLDPQQFDLLPLEILIEKAELRCGLDSAFTGQIVPEEYQKQVQDAIAEERENAYSTKEFPLLVDVIRAQVPADALAKVQRRFRLLDRSPAQLRQRKGSWKP